jgi:hypothetical protein
VSREEALKLADAELERLLRSGDQQVFEAARGSDGRIDQARIVAAAIRARERLADKIMAEAKEGDAT